MISFNDFLFSPASTQAKYSSNKWKAKVIEGKKLFDDSVAIYTGSLGI